ncbi:hypothetical protein E1176_16605 [Fulvivirga sp. RKSG066]|uniref:hypothetical protein n=1 Tax=Fulvivirga aurantia TaxID=2529383 RepID=UPI0012BB9E4D|nr:hypothetical protein [Fulvivirga aurantia]MTI22655.1 hypothetical protein [Fulvivirga aurantia]
MALLSRTELKKEIVKPALETVAGFDGDFEDFTFDHFHDFSMSIFVTKIKELLNQKNYDVLLNDNVIEQWETFKDTIDYLYNEHFEL